MNRQMLIWILILSHLVFINGCTSTQRTSLSEDQIPADENVKILRVILKTGEIIEFNSDGGKYIEKPLPDKLYRAIVGVTVESKVVEISLENAVDIQVEIKSANVMGSIFLLFGIVACVGATWFIILLASWNHSH
jgi:hypothetical protein